MVGEDPIKGAEKAAPPLISNAPLTSAVAVSNFADMTKLLPFDRPPLK
jgi:hypothetical protein